jgi:flagellar FliL protein
MSRMILVLVVLNTIVSFTGLYLAYRPGATEQAVETLVADDNGEPQVPAMQLEDLSVFPVNKVIVSIPGEGREHYFVLDLALYGDAKTEAKLLGKIEPLVRNSVVSALSSKDFQSLRAQSIGEIQLELESVIQRDFARLGIAAPFSHVLVNRLVVQ